MNAPSDSPWDPETGRVVDPAVLAERRARRAGQEPADEDDRTVLRRELEELLAYTEELDAALLAERTERGETERALVADRDRAAAEVAELREELERRVDVRAAVVVELAALRDQLEALGARTGAAGPGDAPTGAERAALRGALADLEAEQARTSARLARVAAELAARETELQGLHEEAEAQRAARTAAEATARTVRAQVVALEQELDAERERRATLEALLEAERARAVAELAGVERTLRSEIEQERVAAAERLAEAQRTVAELRAAAAGTALELGARVVAEQTGGALEALRSELEQAREASALRDERQAAVEALVADLVETAEALRSRFAQGGGDVDLAVALEAERAARVAAEEELAREVAGREAAAQRASDASEALAAGLERLRGAAATDPDDRAGRPPRTGDVPPADHPALARPAGPEAEGPREPPVVVVDLMRAAARLRAEAEAEAEEAGDAVVEVGAEVVADVEEADVEAVEAGDEIVEAGGEVVADAEAEEPDVKAVEADAAPGEDPPRAVRRGSAGLRSVAPPAPAPGARAAADPAAVSAAGTARWFATALPALAAVDAAAAERLLLGALPVQASRTDRDLSYELELPVTGRHQVRVRRGLDVMVSTLVAGDHRSADFRLAGPVGAVAPLATGGAPKRLSGVTIRGRRRRLRRLLRALAAPVGLRQLHAAGVRPRPDDLLALLCLAVDPEVVRGAGFTVAYVDENGGRTFVRAAPEGRLDVGFDPWGEPAPDATVTTDAAGLLGVLAGMTRPDTEGDAEAVATLHGWLRAVQGLEP